MTGQDKDGTAFDAMLVKALGRLPTDQKLVFLEHAKATLGSMSGAMRARTWCPSAKEAKRLALAHHLALTNLIDKSTALAVALERVSRSGIPESYIKEAWAIAVDMQGAQGTPFPDDLPTTLRYLELTALIRLPDPKPKHRPEESSVTTFVVRLLAEAFHSAFGKRPALGSGSPFIRFCCAALPQYDFDVPSLPKMKKIIHERRFE